MGKTTVVQAMTDRLAERATVIVSHSLAFGLEPAPLAAVAGLLSELGRIHGDRRVLAWAGAGAASLAPAYPPAGDPSTGSSVDRLRMFEAMARVLEGAAEQTPVVWVLEDLHWADPSTWQLLQFLVVALTKRSVLVVATYRSDEVVGRHPSRGVLAELRRSAGVRGVDLAALPDRVIVEIVRRVAGAAVPEPRVAGIVAMAEGVPYFAEELARAIQPGRGTRLPATLREALLVRVHRLSDEARQALRIASIFGEAVPHDAWAGLVGTGAGDFSLLVREILDAGMLEPRFRTDRPRSSDAFQGLVQIGLSESGDDGYAFKHALVREVVHDELLDGEHRRLHSDVADLLPDDSLARVHHLFAARRMEDAFAGCLALVRQLPTSHWEAASLYEKLLAAWHSVNNPESVAGPEHEVLARAAAAALAAGDARRALTLVDASIANAPDDLDPLVVADRLIAKGRATWQLDLPGAAAHFERALELVPNDRPTLQKVRALDRLSSGHMLSGEFDDAVRLAEAGLAVAREPGYDYYISSLLNTIGTAWCGQGREDEGLSLLAEAKSLGSGRTLMRAHVNLSHCLNLAGDYTEAMAVARDGIRLSVEGGVERSVGTMIMGNLADPLIALGEYDEAQAVLDQAVAYTTNDRHRSQLQLLLATLRLERDQLEMARTALAEVPDAVPDQQYPSSKAVLTADLLLASGHPEGVVAVARAALGAVPIRTSWDVICLAARARRLTRMEADFVEVAADALPSYRVGPGYRAWLAAETLDTVDAWRAAVKASDLLPVSVQLILSGELGRSMVTAGSVAEGRAVLDATIVRADRLGATLRVRQLRSLLEQAQAAVPKRAHPGQLTPRELEVLKLLAQGRSNGQIAAELFVTTKTASVHVSSILAKAQVASRGEAVSWARKQGLV